MRKLMIQKLAEGKPLSPRKRNNYITVINGCVEIAQNFLELSKIYMRAINKNADIGEYTSYHFHELPPNFCFCLEAAIDLYNKLTENGIDFTDSGKSYFTLTINNDI